ncbi:MAG: caspase family protein [Saprospiraceae bacterium]|nr:caspase family protein [Saprospiraceae bacterium]
MAKKALVVGVNDYAPVGAGGPDLNGCVNDATDIANTLVICGFKPSDIRIITNHNATNTNIKRWLNWLFNGIKSGDSLVFYYSGHGTRVTSFGDDLEVDGLDEAICPHDYQTAGVIKDDEFRTLFSQKMKAGVNLEVIFDCCHSGTGTRNLTHGLNALHQDLKVRMIPPDAETEFYSAYVHELKAVERTTRQLVNVPNLNHTLWAGCKDNQLCYESNVSGQIRGHFTRELCRVLRATSGNITRRLLDQQVQRALASYGNNQTNQTESKAAEFSQKVFT